MKPSEDLFRLIKSLSKQEKRFFKLQANTSEGGKNYSILFDLMDKQEVYDENTLKKKLANTSIVKHLPSEKNYLQRAILRSLRIFHDEISVNVRLEGYLRNIEILFKKRLLTACEKQLVKAFEIAREFELYHAIIQLIDWQYKLYSRFEQYDSLSNYESEGLKEKLLCLDKIREVAMAEKITYEVIAIDRLTGTASDKKLKSRMEQLFKEAKKLENSINDNFFASELTLTALYYLSYLLQDYRSALKYNKAAVALFESKSQFKNERAGRYYTHLVNLIRRLIELKEYSSVEKYINAVKSFVDTTDPVVTKEITPEMNSVLFIYELEYLGDTGQVSKALKVIKDFQAVEAEGKSSHEPSLTFSSALNTVRIYFIAGEYQQAHKLLKRIIQTDHQLQKDLIGYSLILRALLAVELSKSELFTFLSSEGKNFFKEIANNESALLLFELLDSIAKGKKIQDLAGGFVKKLEAIENDTSAYFPLLKAWGKSKKTGSALPTLLKKENTDSSF